jgi:thiamine phosphate synthase YjbQ (UPF0047 family)
VTVVTDTVHFNTKGDADMVNLTEDVRRLVSKTGLRAGTVTVFVPGATGAITTLSLSRRRRDFCDLFDRVASWGSTTTTTTPTRREWHAHGADCWPFGCPSTTASLPGRWQEICFVLDNRPCERTVIGDAWSPLGHRDDPP